MFSVSDRLEAKIRRSGESEMTTWQVVRWWELRRLPYNAILFVIGIASIFAMEFFAQKVNSAGDAPELETGLTIVLYGLIANLCYTLGWIVELIARRKDKARARLRAKKLFLMGLWGSCLLTSAPFWFGVVFWMTNRSR
ncbi:MAG: hypothetical protein ABSE53_14015 [Terracidiphilus sp.]